MPITITTNEPKARKRVLCIHGAQGVGKTTFGLNLGKALLANNNKQGNKMYVYTSIVARFSDHSDAIKFMRSMTSAGAFIIAPASNRKDFVVAVLVFDN